MAVFAITNQFISINSVNLSDHVKSATLTVDVDQLDPTAMGDTYKEVLGGLKSGTLAITFNDDYAGGSVDATLWPLLGTTTAFLTRPDAAAVSATNPNYSGNVMISQHTMGGGIGELAAKGLSWPTSGTITRATA